VLSRTGDGGDAQVFSRLMALRLPSLDKVRPPSGHHATIATHLASPQQVSRPAILKPIVGIVTNLSRAAPATHAVTSKGSLPPPPHTAHHLIIVAPHHLTPRPHTALYSERRWRCVRVYSL
jgi:hypothetical protein